MKSSTLVVCASALTLGLVLLIVGFGLSNKEIRLRNQITAQQKKNEATFDKTWKIISQQANVTDSYKESFRAVYNDMMANRYQDNKNLMMKWVQESNPNFDVSLFTKLMTTIEAQRETFNREQALLLDLQREHTDCLTTFPSSLVCGRRDPIDVKIVTSTKTGEAFESGHEDEVKLFPSDKNR